MSRLLQNRHLIRENLALLIGLCLCFYFGYHTLQGERSIIRLVSLEHSIATLSLQHDSMVVARAALEQKVGMLRPASINRDFLEENAREILGYSRADEVLIVGH
jgi:cell division protein FtsB